MPLPRPGPTPHVPLRRPASTGTSIAHDLRPIYTAPTAADARYRFEEFAEKWGTPYPAIKTAVGERLGGVHTLPRLRRRDPQGHLQHERDRERQRPHPQGRPRPRALPQPNSRR